MAPIGMPVFARRVANSGDLLWEWTARTIRARYQQSLLGWLWALIQPAAQVAIFTLVFTRIIPVDTAGVPYVVFAYVAVVPWTLLAMSLPDMSNSLVDNMALVTKIYFEREALPVAAMLARLLDYAIAMVLVFLLLLFYQVSPITWNWLYLPLILAVELILILGLGLALATLNVFFRDIRSLLVLALQLWFYASPIVYPTSAVPERLRPLYDLNPMTGIIEAQRDVLLFGRAPGISLWIAAAIAVLVLVAGYWLFRTKEYQFADIV